MAKNVERVVTPVARIMYPSIIVPETKGQYPSNKYKADLYIPAEEFQTERGTLLLQAIEKVASTYYAKPMKIGEFKMSLMPVEQIEKHTREKLPKILQSGYVRIKAKSVYKPSIVDAKRNSLSDDVAKNIGNGDKVIAVLDVFPYEQSGGGVTFGLGVVQYIEPKGKDEEFGGSGSKGLELLSDVEVKVEDVAQGLPGLFGAPK